jgi:hypothetical protein
MGVGLDTRTGAALRPPRNFIWRLRGQCARDRPVRTDPTFEWSPISLVFSCQWIGILLALLPLAHWDSLQSE